MIEYFIPLILSISLIIYTYKQNAYRRIERFLWKNSKIYFWIWTLCYFIIEISLFYNAKSIILALIKKHI